METLIERAAGLDVQQATVVACVVIEQDGARLKREPRTFETVRREDAIHCASERMGGGEEGAHRPTTMWPGHIPEP